MTTTLSLLVLRARDIEATVAFYRALGLEFSPEQHSQGPRHFACEKNGFVLEIYPLKANQSEVNDSFLLGFGVESLEAALEKLQQSAQTKTGDSRFCTVFDPDGRSVRLQEA